MRRFFADTTPLRAPDFRRLWLAGIVTVIGANVTIFPAFVRYRVAGDDKDEKA